MNSINGVMARIQEILNRIHEIQAAQGRVSGTGPQPSAGGISAPRATDPGVSAQRSTSGAASAAKKAQFRQLLQQALSAETSGLASTSGSGSSSPLTGDLSGLGSLSNLESILGGATGSTSGVSGSNASALQQYQKELVQALQQLAAQRKQNNITQ